MPQPSDRKPGEGQRVLVGQPKHLARTSRLAQTQARKGITGEESGQHSVAMVLCGGAGRGGGLCVKVQRNISHCLLLAVQP